MRVTKMLVRRSDRQEAFFGGTSQPVVVVPHIPVSFALVVFQNARS